MQKYYDNPARYVIEDGILRCGNTWSLYIDNHHDDFVSAYLGDLGRDLPNLEEQQHWKKYNVVIDGYLSKAKFLRDFGAIFAAPDSPVFIFQNEYRILNAEFNNRYNWPLFLPLHGDDKYNFAGLRLPLSNAQPEFDSLVLSLVKVLIDSINEEQINKKLTDKINGGISRLEKWLESTGLNDYQTHIKFLRNLQELRSCTSGHRKGKGYTKIMSILSISNDDLKAGYKSIIISAIDFLKFMNENIEQLS